MTISKEDELLIERFHEKSLTDAEKELFRKNFENNSDFAAAVRGSSEELLILKASETEHETKLRILSIRKFAAVFLFLLASALVVVYFSNQDNREIAYSNFYENTNLSFSLINTLRSGDLNETNDSDLRDVSSYYFSDQKMEALSKLEKLSNTKVNDPELKLMLADLYFELQKPNKAKGIYIELLISNDNQTHIKYRLGLAYLASGDKISSEAVLMDIIQSKEPPYDQKAVYLLQSINSFKSKIHVGNWF